MSDMTTASSLSTLLAIEEIKQLKARYFRFVDMKEWTSLADVFTADCRVQFPGGGDRWSVGRERVIAFVDRVIGEALTVHHGHMPEISVTSATTATGIWAMFDDVETVGPPASRFRGYGHYHERYRKEDDGHWRIEELRLTRLRVDHS